MTTVDDLRKEFATTLHNISKDTKSGKALLIGSGPSIDTLNVERLQGQSKYDVCTITDAISIFTASKSVQYAINFHYQGFRRIKDYLQLAEHVLLPKSIFSFHIAKRESRDDSALDEEMMMTLYEKIKNLKNIYFFKPNNVKPHDIKKGRFNIEFKDDVIVQAQGSVVGAFYFLAVYMHYKEIYYIGFDGSDSGNNMDDAQYAESIGHKRKNRKLQWARRDYLHSWSNLHLMKDKYYSDVIFEPFTDKEFLLENTTSE